MNDPQNADELPTKIITFVGEATTGAIINEVIPVNHAELCESLVVVVFLFVFFFFFCFFTQSK